MKKALKCFVFTILLLITSVIISIIANAATPVVDKSRNVPTELSWTSGGGDLLGRDQVYFPNVLPADYLCVRHGGISYSFVMPMVEFRIENYHEIDESEIKEAKEADGENLLFSVDISGKNITDSGDLPKVMVEPLEYSGSKYCGGVKTTPIGESNNPIKTTGVTVYRPLGQSDFKNDAYAYILSEIMNNAGAPNDSYVNHAVWDALANANEGSSGAEYGTLPSPSGGTRSDGVTEERINSLQEEIDEINGRIQEYQENIDKLNDEINELEQDIAQVQAEIEGLENQINYTEGTEIPNLENWYNNLLWQRSDLQSDIYSLESYLDDLQYELYDPTLSEEDRQAIIYEINDVQYSISQKRSEIQSIETQMEDTLDEIAEARARLQTYKNDLKEKQKKKSKLDKKVATKQKKIKSLQKSADYKDDSKQLKDRIKELEDYIQQIENADFENDAQNSGATNLYNEAVWFNRMWNTIRQSYGGQYKNSIIDLTEKNKVEVEFDSEKQEYIIGPFSVSYLEVLCGKTSFAGMAGTPELTVNIDGRMQQLKWEQDWEFYYKGERDWSKAYLLDIGNDTKSTYNQYPHSGESFYLKIKYKKGMNAIGKMKFYFRCLEASGSWNKFKGSTTRISWEGIPRLADLCQDWVDCECGGHHTSAQHDSEGNETCSGGARACPHNPEDGYHDHYCTLNIYSKLDEIDEVPLQDFARVTASSREYSGAIYGGTDNQEPSMEFDWEIDLTTSIAGDVWAEVEDTKNRQSNSYIGIMNDDDEKVKNVAVTVYLYQNDKKKEKAIAHKENGEVVQWPILTDEKGHWHVDRLEAPAIEKDSTGRYFYVVEYEYDGQVYKHTVFLGKEAGKVTNNGPEADECKPKEYVESPDNYAKSSMAVEEVNDRYVFDQSFGEITGESAIGGDNSTNGITGTTDENGNVTKKNSGELKYKGESVQETGTSNGGAENSPTGNTRIQSKLDTPFSGEENRVVSNIAESKTAEADKRYRMVSSTYYNNTDTHGISVTKADYRLQYPLCTMSNDRSGGNSPWKYKLNKKGTSNSVGNDGIFKGQKYIDEYMLHINLGLLKRRETDISVLKDLNNVTMVVNEQMVCKEYNPYADIKDYSNILFQMEMNRATNQYYELGLYTSDVSYSSYSRYRNAINEVKELKKNTELRVFASYVVRVYNNSETNDVEINELTDYFDSSFTLVEDDVKASIVDEDMKRHEKVVANKPYYRIISKGEDGNPGTADGLIEWKPMREDNLNGFDSTNSGDLKWDLEGQVNNTKVSTTKTFDTIKLKNDQYIEIFTTYEIDKEGYEALAGSSSSGSGVNVRTNLFGEKNNVAELSSYSTYYSDEDKCEFYCGYKAGTGNKSGWVSGRVDRDSAPNNINRNNVLDRNKYEDDTYMAKTLRIQLETYERDMTGYVWDDKKTDNLGRYNLKVGNGTRDSDETLIQNVEVSMYEVINLDTVTGGNGVYDGLEYYYKVPQEFYNYANKDDKTGINGTGPIKTSSSTVSSVTGESAGNYYIYGFLAGDYILRFDYGAENNSGETDDPEYIGNPKSIIKYNGQDYENTAFMAGEAERLNDKYLDISGKTSINGTDINELEISKARDNESRRMYVDAYSRNIENDRGEILRNRYADNEEYVESTRMFAETPVMQVEIRDPKIMKQYTTNGGEEGIDVEKVDPKKFGTDETDNTSIKNYKYSIKNINLGLEERAKTDIATTQFIEEVLLLKQEDIVFRAKFDEETRDVIRDHPDSMNLDKLTSLPQSSYSNNGFYYVAIEDEYLNDLSVIIKYNTKFTNQSEVDFTGKLSGKYLAEDIRNLANQSPTTVDYKYSTGEALVENLDNIKESIGKDNDVGISMNYSAGNASNPQDTIRPEVIVYGRYVGRYYYENKIFDGENTYEITKYSKVEGLRDIPVTYVPDEVVRTTVDQIIDYIDVNTSLYNNTAVNTYWNAVTDTRDSTTISNEFVELKGLLGKDSYRNMSAIDPSVSMPANDVYDEKDRALVRGVNSNIAISYNERLNYEDIVNDRQRVKYETDEIISDYNPKLTQELEPVDYANDGGNIENTYSRLNIYTRKNVTSGMESNEMKMDNLVEVLVYSNTTGRRDCNSVPGNAMTIATYKGTWCAGYNSVEYLRNNTNWGALYGSVARNENNWRIFPENDAFAPEFVTLAPPMGISLHNYVKRYMIPIIVLVGAIVLLIVLFGIKQVEIRTKSKNSKL